MSTKKILVIEDNQKHLADAKAFFADKPEYEVKYATSGEAAHDTLLRGNKFDGVITDVFLPFNHDNQCSEEPIGFGLAILCRKLGIRSVMLTDCSSHGQRVQWIQASHQALGLDMAGPNGEPPAKLVLSGKGGVSAQTKSWRFALYLVLPVPKPSWEDWAGKTQDDICGV